MNPREQVIRRALLESNEALLDLMCLYAPEFSSDVEKADARHRIKKAGGTLAYIADIRKRNTELLASTGAYDDQGRVREP